MALVAGQGLFWPRGALEVCGKLWRAHWTAAVPSPVAPLDVCVLQLMEAVGRGDRNNLTCWGLEWLLQGAGNLPALAPTACQHHQHNSGVQGGEMVCHPEGQTGWRRETVNLSALHCRSRLGMKAWRAAL